MNSVHGSHFDMLNDDTLCHVLNFVGEKSYYSFGGINSRCNSIFKASNLAKETFLYGYAPTHMIARKLAVNRCNHTLVGKSVIQFNRKDVLCLLLEKGLENLLRIIGREAAKAGSIGILTELFNDPDGEEVLISIKKYGTLCMDASSGNYVNNVKTLKWLHETMGCSFDWRSCKNAAQAGNLEALKYLRENGCAWNLSSCNVAAQYGRLEILKYLRENGCEWQEHHVCVKAAEGGHLEIIRYVKENDKNSRASYTHPHICGAAAYRGHLEVLQWLFHNGDIFGIYVCAKAIQGRQVHVLLWLREQMGSGWIEKGTVVAAENNEGNRLQILEWLRERDIIG